MSGLLAKASVLGPSGVWGGHSPRELLAQDSLGCGEHLVETRKDWVDDEASVLEGWHQGL